MDKPQLPKMLKKLQLFVFFVCALIGFSSNAQTYPVSVTTQILQPSPIYLSNYADATTINSPIKLQLVLNDLTISNRQVRLKLYFQGNSISFSSNNFVVGARPLYLEGGFPLQLTNVDLAPYFEYQNILGINPNQYAQPLPEGVYNFSVEVYDFATNKKLSKKTAVTTIIFQNEPPFLNLPLNGASIMQQNIQNIVFSWTPRSINVSNVEYEFSLVEIWDNYTPVQNAFAYSPPLYTTTTRNTTLQYGITQPQLIPGKKYAWRIKAKAILGAEEIGVFKNNGYSEVFSFTYEVFCTAPLSIATSGVSQDQAKITWSGSIDNYDYQVNYREKNSTEWYKLVTPRETINISNLKPNTAYEYTVGASCDVGKYTHSTIHEFTTLARDEIAFAGCGIQPDPKDLKNKNPLPSLFPNDVVTAGDFPIVVLHASGSNGSFTGDGYVTLPFLEKFRKLIDAADAAGGSNIGKFSRIRITFNNIGVNTDFKLISGEIVASYDPNWGSMIDGDKLVGGNDNQQENSTEQINQIPFTENFDLVIVESTINYDVNTKTLTFKDDQGKSYSVIIDKESSGKFDDNSGQKYEINKDGVVEKAGTVEDLIARKTTMDDLDSLIFSRHDIKFDKKTILPIYLSGQEIEIKLVKQKETYFNLSDLQDGFEIKLGDKVIPYTIIGEELILKIKADLETLGESITLNAYENWENKKNVGRVTIQTYSSPVVNFFKPNGYNNEFLFDEGFRLHQTLKELTSDKSYKHFEVGKNKQIYYAPVLGLLKNKTASINVELENFKDLATKDPSFGLTFKPSLPGKIKLNEQDDLTFSGTNLKKSTQINIKALENIDGNKLTSIMIDVFIKDTDQKVGAIEYLCASPINQTVKLIYTKCKDETDFYRPYTPQQLETYLNTSAFNQLFIKFIVNTEDYIIADKTTTEMFADNRQSITKILGQKYKTTNPTSSQIGDFNDVFFITSWVATDAGARHLLGSIGGILYGIANNNSEEIKYEYSLEATSHEFGHRYGLPHTFQELIKIGIPKIAEEGTTKNNTMDYKVDQKTWFKVQLFSMQR